MKDMAITAVLPLLIVDNCVILQRPLDRLSCRIILAHIIVSSCKNWSKEARWPETPAG
jgi:hypothetical protein